MLLHHESKANLNTNAAPDPSNRPSPVAKKRLDDGPALILINSRNNFDLVIESGVLTELIQASCRAPLGVKGPENNALDASVNDGPHAHGTRFNSNIERCS